MLGLEVAVRGRGSVAVSTELCGPPIATIDVGRGRTPRVELPAGLSGRSALYFTFAGRGEIDFHGFALTC